MVMFYTGMPHLQLGSLWILFITLLQDLLREIIELIIVSCMLRLDGPSLCKAWFTLDLTLYLSIRPFMKPHVTLHHFNTGLKCWYQVMGVRCRCRLLLDVLFS